MDNSIPITNLKLAFDFKTVEIEHPTFLLEEDAIRQYAGIWKIIWMYVHNLNAKKVLEFGTREGYSTQLFSHLLHFTEGHLWTVDLDDPKIKEEIKSKLDNVTFVKENVLGFTNRWFALQGNFDILYIDDWHNPYHLYEELDRFAKYARVILIHDVCQNWQTHEWLIPSIFSWCQKEFMPFTIYPLNACGLVAIHREEYQNFYKVAR